MTAIGYILVAIIALAVLSVAAYWLRYQWRLRSHQGLDRRLFVEHFARLGIDTEIAATVYDCYKSLVVWRTFQISPNDDLDAVFGHAPEEMDSSLDAILGKLHLSLPPRSLLRERDQKQSTIADVVHLVAWIAEHQSAEH